jgi:hypothetical protein
LLEGPLFFLFLLTDIFEADLDANHLTHVSLIRVHILRSLFQHCIEVVLVFLFNFLLNVLFEDLLEEAAATTS